MINIVDYGACNLGSLKRKLERLGIESVISSDANDIINYDQIILPGVGCFLKEKKQN